MPTINCPFCNQIYNVESSIIGQNVCCTICNKTFVAKPQTIYILQPKQTQTVPSNPKRRVAYIAWAIFLGHLGFHDFYAEYYLFGFIHLGLSFLTGVASAVTGESCSETMIISYIWAIIEIFVIKKDEKGIPMK